ncbi:MAG TPA: hypothetical protein PLE28_00620 [bacterium]|nr:hypothetical protein [bacterium]
MNETDETNEIKFFLEPLTEFANMAIEVKVKEKKVYYLDVSGNKHCGFLTTKDVVADVSKTIKCFPEIKFNIFVVNNSGILEENGFHFQQHPDYY